jgi:hypothetical protein
MEYGCERESRRGREWGGEGKVTRRGEVKNSVQ